MKKANEKLAELKAKAMLEKKDLLFEKEFCPAYSENFTAEVFPDDVMIEALKSVAADSEYARWAYNESVQGMASGEVQFDVVNWELSTAHYTQGSFDDNPEIITIFRFDQNEEANADFDFVRDAIGQDYDEILGWAKSEFGKDDDEDDNEFLYRIEGEPSLDEKIKELTGQTIDQWKEDYLCEDTEIDWGNVFYDPADY